MALHYLSSEVQSRSREECELIRTVEYVDGDTTSVCNYWALVGLTPFVALILGVCLVVAVPFLGLGWCIKKLAKRYNWNWKAPKCPWGNVEFE